MFYQSRLCLQIEEGFVWAQNKLTELGIQFWMDAYSSKDFGEVVKIVICT
jgi:hypothetical protein